MTWQEIARRLGLTLTPVRRKDPPPVVIYLPKHLLGDVDIKVLRRKMRKATP